MHPEPVKPVQEILGAVGNSVILGKEECALIIFKSLRSNGGDEVLIDIEGL